MRPRLECHLLVLRQRLLHAPRPAHQPKPERRQRQRQPNRSPRKVPRPCRVFCDRPWTFSSPPAPTTACALVRVATELSDSASRLNATSPSRLKILPRILSRRCRPIRSSGKGILLPVSANSGGFFFQNRLIVSAALSPVKRALPKSIVQNNPNAKISSPLIRRLPRTCSGGTCLSRRPQNFAPAPSSPAPSA